MRTSMRLVGVGLMTIGVVWILQGIGVIEGSFMTGSSFWAWMGALAIMAGLPLVVRSLRRR